MSMRTASAKKLYFHAVDLMSTDVTRKELQIILKKVNRTLMSMAISLEQKAWEMLRKSCLLGSLHTVIWPHLFFNGLMVDIPVVSQ